MSSKGEASLSNMFKGLSCSWIAAKQKDRALIRTGLGVRENAWYFATILSRSRAGLGVREDSSESLLCSRAPGPVWRCESVVANCEREGRMA